jgi:hypothetical protein
VVPDTGRGPFVRVWIRHCPKKDRKPSQTDGRGRTDSDKTLSQSTLVCSRGVSPQGPSFSLAGAGSVLIGFTAACIVAGALIGWAVGRVGIGVAIGAVVGIPVGVATTVLKYRNV